MHKSYYDVLEIPKSSPQKDVKKAFRKKAMVYHPDKPTGNEELFRQINTAYEVLSDPEKRQKYDQYGENFEQMGGGNADINDLFRGMMGGGGGGMHHRNQVKKCDDIRHVLKISLKQVYTGTVRKLKINRKIECTTCDGFGTKDKTESKCNCNNGMKTMMRQIGPGMMQQMNVPCNLCQATGFRVTNKENKCGGCSGMGVVNNQHVITVDIPKGIRNKSTLCFEGQANGKRDCISGDVLISINIDQSEHLHLQGNNLIMSKKITLAEALSGFSFVLEQLDGRELYISNRDRVITPNQLIKIKNEGIPISNTPHYGDLIIKFDIVFPTSIQHTEILPKLFGQEVNKEPIQKSHVKKDFEFIDSYKNDRPQHPQHPQHPEQQCRQQ